MPGGIATGAATTWTLTSIATPTSTRISIAPSTRVIGRITFRAARVVGSTIRVTAGTRHIEMTRGPTSPEAVRPDRPPRRGTISVAAATVAWAIEAALETAVELA